MNKEHLRKLDLYGTFLFYRWNLNSARSAGSLRLAFKKDYEKRICSLPEIIKIHHKGWSVEDWMVCGVEQKNSKDYLSTVDYRKMHPLNGIYSSWIDDKLTLKYLCLSKKLYGLMPNYYYQVIDSSLVNLPDCPDEFRGMAGMISLLRGGSLAVKKIKGSLGVGFYRAEYKNGKYYLNEKIYNEDEFCKFILSLNGYIITEYLRPHPDMHIFSANTPNTIRYLVANDKGNPLFLKSFIRFGTSKTGFVENYNSGGVLCFIDENGFYYQGNVIDKSHHNVVIKNHPDTGAALKGKVPEWDQVVNAANIFCRAFPQLEYLGFDFVVTEDSQVKMLEINSLTSLDAIQLDCSVFDLKNASYFRAKLNK